MTFKVKYAVQEIEEELNRGRQTTRRTAGIRVLAAEWTYLNQPERLAELNRHFLQLAPMTVKQLQWRIEDMPLRPPSAPGPDAIPYALIAANPAVGGPSGATPAAPSREAILAVAASSVPPLAAAPAGATRAGDTVVVNEANSSEAQLAKAASDARPPEPADGAAALAEALQLLGVDAGGYKPGNWWAKAAPIAAAHAAEAGTAEPRSPKLRSRPPRATYEPPTPRRTRRQRWPRPYMCSAVRPVDRLRG